MKIIRKQIPKLLSLSVYALGAIVLTVYIQASVLAQPAPQEPIPNVPREFESNDIPFWNPYLPPCTPGGGGTGPNLGVGVVSESASSTAAAGEAIGPEIDVGVSVYGNWGDDNGQGMLGPHKGHTMFAELSTPGTMDFALLANMLNAAQSDRGWAGYNGFRAGTKFRLTYQGRSIIMEKRDVGGGGGPVNGVPRAVDLWWETAQLIGWTDYGLAVMKIQQVADSTPVTPIGGSPEQTPGGDTTGGGAAAEGGTNNGLGCSDAGAGSATGGSNPVNSEGYAFPVQLTQGEVYDWGEYKWPCIGTCHHDRTPAFDLTKKPGNNTGTGVPIIAINTGTITNVKNSYSGQAGCQTFQLQGEDGFMYWYGHIQQAPPSGTKVQAGQQVGVIGERRCTGNGSAPHLHIDRGAPKGRSGGSVCCRDSGLVPLMNQLYAELGG